MTRLSLSKSGVTANDLYRVQRDALPQAVPRQSAKWRVLHACEYARDILPLVEGQVNAGMRPYLVTPQGSGTAELYLGKKDMGQRQTLSLLRAWHDVRNWRNSILECDPGNTSDLVHTHSFSSGMAGVRNLTCVVYDFNACIEESAISAGLCERGSWMGRSFRVAEQFILTRAQAVVVHAAGMRSAAEERGVPPENLFLVPHPLPADEEYPLLESQFLQQRFGLNPGVISYFVPYVSQTEDGDLAPGVVQVLRAYATVVREIPQSRLLIEIPFQSSAAVRMHAERLGVGEYVLVVDPNESSAAMRGATIVVVTGDLPEDRVRARHANELCRQSLLSGKPLLAADVSRNRDASPQGAGCLWFSPDDVRELGHRMAFLGLHDDFRLTLANAGRAYVLRSLNNTAVGLQYDAVYRHALSQKRIAGPGQQANTLAPLNCAV